MEFRRKKKKKTKIMTSSPSLHGKEKGGKVEAVADFILGDSKINMEVDCSCEIKDICSLEGKL